MTRSLGPRGCVCCIRYFVIISSKKPMQDGGNSFVGTGKVSLLCRILCCIRSLYIEFPLYVICYSLHAANLSVWGFLAWSARRCRRTLAGCLAVCPAGSGVFQRGQAPCAHVCIVTCRE